MGATGTTYTLTEEADFGKKIKVRATYTDAGGFVNTPVSAATATVADVPGAPGLRFEFFDSDELQFSMTTPNTGGSPITGWVCKYRSITATDSDSDANLHPNCRGEGTWRIPSHDFGTIQEARVRAVNAVGAGPWTRVRVNRHGEVTQLATPTDFTATAGNGQVSFTWSAVPNAGGYTITRHVSGGTDETQTPTGGGSATSHTWTGLANDEAHTFSMIATGTGQYYDSEPTAQLTATPMAVPNTPATGKPTIAPIGGPLRVGRVLEARTAGIADANGLTAVSYSYQWIRVDGQTETDISGATNQRYTVQEADFDKTIKVRVSFTDDIGYAEALTSDGTASVPLSIVFGLPLPAFDEATLNGATFNLLIQASPPTWATAPPVGSVTVTGLAGVSIRSLTRNANDATQLDVVLDYDGTDFDTDQTLTVAVTTAAHSGSFLAGTVGTIPVTAVVEQQLATPAGLNLTAGDGRIDVSWDDVANESGYRVEWVCDTESGDAGTNADATSYRITNLANGVACSVKVKATGTGQYLDSEFTAPLTATPMMVAASISSTTPAALTETNLNGAKLTVTLVGATFSGTGAPPASAFTLTTAVTGLTVSGVSRSSGTEVVLTLAHTRTDFDSDATVAVTVAASATSHTGDLTTAAGRGDGDARGGSHGGGHVARGERRRGRPGDHHGGAVAGPARRHHGDVENHRRHGRRVGRLHGADERHGDHPGQPDQRDPYRADDGGHHRRERRDLHRDGGIGERSGDRVGRREREPERVGAAEHGHDPRRRRSADAVDQLAERGRGRHRHHDDEVHADAVGGERQDGDGGRGDRRHR